MRVRGPGLEFKLGPKVKLRIHYIHYVMQPLKCYVTFISALNVIKFVWSLYTINMEYFVGSAFTYTQTSKTKTGYIVIYTKWCKLFLLYM